MDLNYLGSIFLVAMISSGLLSLLLAVFRFSLLSVCFSILSLILGGYWCCFAAFPVSLIGGLVAICGAIAIGKSDY